MIFPDIEEGARWTVVENDKEGPVIKRWEPYPEDLRQDAVSASTPLPPAAVLLERVACVPTPLPCRGKFRAFHFEI